MEKVLTVPNADQLDDWEDYKAAFENRPEEDLMEEMYEDMLDYGKNLVIKPEDTERIGSIDSGYFSPNPATL